MPYFDEKDYIMRMINELARVLFSLLFGKNYVQVELPKANKYKVSGRTLEEYLRMVDCGDINEAENFILEDIDYSSTDEVAAALFFYQYVSKKDSAFLQEHHYSEEEVLDGLRELSRNSGYGAIGDLLSDQI